jgi:pilus assembly protein CpaC
VVTIFQQRNSRENALLRDGFGYALLTVFFGEQRTMDQGIKLAARGWLLAVLLSLTAAGQTTVPAPADAQAPTTPASSAQAPASTQESGTTTLPPQSNAASGEPQGSAPLRVMVGKSLLINTSERLKRISVTDPGVADALVVTPTQVLVHGRSPGEVSLLIWDELERSRSFDLRVDVDVTAAAEEIHRIFPDELITVTPSRNAMVLNGHVSTEDVSKRAGLIGEAYTKNVVNVLTFGPVGAQEVLLEVKFAEVDRSAVSQLGINVLSTGAGNVVGNTTTGQYGTAPTGLVQSNATGTGSTTSATVTDLLNLFLFSPEIHLGATIKALQAKNLLQILAEPNLIAVNGKEASFLAGGEFPFPVVQPANGINTVTIQFKQFGVQLKFTPVITPAGLIHLHVAPEVSTLDFANGITIGGTTIPALSTRKAETEFELLDGQSFVIAGLMDNRVTKLVDKVPGLGDIPILGNLFRSTSFSRNNSELVVLVTARRVSPTTGLAQLPKYPQPFLENGSFDGKPAAKAADKNVEK